MEIRTERCTIRPFLECDLDAFITYRNDPDWMRYQGFKGLTRKEYADAVLGRHSLPDGRQLAVICNSSQSLIGDLYLRQENDIFWIGYTICRPLSRRGYACEAVLAVIGWLRARGASCVKAEVERGNTASAAMLRRLEFQLEADGQDTQIFALRL